MLTWQDLEAAGLSVKERAGFIERLIKEHKKSDEYKTAVAADAYDKQRNPTIMEYVKLLQTITGEMVQDNLNANYKLPSNFFNRFITQANQYLLGNGVMMEYAQKDKLGADFDIRLQEVGRAALMHGVCFAFFNMDHVEVFRLTEFAPLWDEETGALKAGVRYWQIDAEKPLRATLYETDGYSEYIKRKGKDWELRQDKRAYKLVKSVSEVEGEVIVNGENYSGFPVIPMWGSPLHQSALIGLRQNIDCYDLIKSGFANDIDDASMIYWVLTNTGGMNETDLAEFVNRMNRIRVATVDGDVGAKAEAHTMDVPYESRIAYLERLEADMYKDFQALNINNLAAGNKTATEIDAAYEPLNTKTDLYEYCVLDFLHRLFAIAGVEDTPSFVRSRIVNQLEETQMVMMVAQHLDDETILRKLPWLTPEEVDEILARKDAEDVYRQTGFGGQE